ncbi:antigen 5 like allergen Cul n 1-like [Musca vetustissima]|uniref:antigen 5 like allergen Cul n 1-like n=1 Tax=Musca vetustissima TaxID=27455 RepID=UPI002AB72B27|nr:antigen 5 like allergen Cul n 1-like [Musca vetustissima]
MARLSFNLFAGLLIASLALAKATDYCSKSLCKEGVNHIACGHDGKLSDACPSDAQLVEIDDNLKKVLVNAHNAKRNLIAGGEHDEHDPACRMATIQWDDELALLAALNVLQCDMKHDRCRNTDAFKYSGQNIAWLGYHGQANNAGLLEKAVDFWYSEVADSKMEYINKYPKNYTGPAIGHFTVMVADRNVRVGCAATTYFVEDEEYKAYLVTCNYATTNMINFPIYKRCDKAAEDCTTGTNDQYPNLCSTSEEYAVNKWF